MQPVVILVHGTMQSPWFFEPLRARLSDRGIAARTPQLPSSNADSGVLQALRQTSPSCAKRFEPPLGLS